MKNYLNLKRKSILISMKTLIYFLPIGQITSNLYVFFYGKYYFQFNKDYILDNLSLTKVFFTIGMFCALSLIAIGIEKFLLPEIILLMKTKKPGRAGLVYGKKYSIRRSGIDSLEVASKKYPNEGLKLKMLKDFMYTPVLLVFCLVAFNSIWSYMAIIPVFYLTLEYGRKFTSLLSHYNVK